MPIEQAKQEGGDGQQHDPECQLPAQAIHLQGQRGLHRLDGLQQTTDVAQFGVIPGADDDGARAPLGDQGSGVQHVVAFGQGGRFRQGLRLFVDTDRFTGESTLLHVEIVALQQTHIGRHLVA